MAKEIERKFLISADADLAALLIILRSFPSSIITQGYLHDSPAVRIRIVGVGQCASAFLTIKGPKVGFSQDEFEYSIPLEDARSMMEMCGERKLSKTRCRVPHGEQVIEVDIFHGKHEGLIMAEVELASENEHFDIPSWFGKEVTSDITYSNASLAS